MRIFGDVREDLAGFGILHSDRLIAGCREGRRCGIPSRPTAPANCPDDPLNESVLPESRIEPMSEPEHDRMQARLDAFGRLLDARTREFKETGEFSDQRQLLISQIRGSHDRMQARLASAKASGSSWDLIRVEFERDLGSIYDDLLLLNNRLDAEQMKQRRE